MRSLRNAAIIGLALLGTASVSRAADIIYQENFDGAGGVLTGQSPDVESGLDGGSATATWGGDSVASANPDAVWTTSGGTYTGPGSTDATIGLFGTGADSNLITNEYLPFTPQVGYIYDLELSIAASGVGASGNWIGLAFATAGLNTHTTGGGSSALSNDNTYGLILDKGSGQVQSFGGVGTGNAKISTAAGFLTQGTTTPLYDTFDVLLNTSGSQWVVSWLVNGSATGLGTNSYTYTTNPSIGDVIFGTNKLTGAVDPFILSATAVPEPASMLGLATMCGGILLRRRKRS
jgi:hypothetical protein